MSGDGTLSLDLAQGLTSQRSWALAALVAKATGLEGAAGDLPWLAPALLFAEDAVQRELTLPDVAPGQVLVQDYQAIRYAGHFPLDAALRASTTQIAKGSTAEYRFTLADTDGVPRGDMDTALRLVPSADVGRAKPAQFRTATLKDTTCSAEFALSQAQVDTYLELSGDRNPIHCDSDAAKAMGLDAPVVPGLLLVSLIQPFCKSALPDCTLIGLKARFLSPLCVGANMKVCVQRRGTDANAGTTRLRAYLLAQTDRAIAITDLVMTDRADH